MNIYKKKRKRSLQEKITPEKQMLFDELCNTMRKLGVEVRLESGRFAGGYCIVDDRQFFYINKNNLIDYNIDLLISQLKLMDIENVFLSPRVRLQLEQKAIDMRG